jgi:flagellar hook-length control protein FliK
MQTPAILNIASTAPNAQPSKPNAGTEGNASFDRMLNQQLAEKRAAQNSQERRGAQAPKAAEKAAEKPAQKQPEKSGAESKTAAETDTATKTTESDKSKSTSAQEADPAQVPAVATDMLIPAEQPTATELLASSDILGMAVNPALRQPAAEASAPQAGANALADALNAATERRGAAAGIDLKAQQAPTAAAAAQGDDFATQLATQASAAMVSTSGQESAASASSIEINPAGTALQNLQQTGVDSAKASGPAANHLAPRVGTQGWDQALGQKVVWMVAGAQQSASLSLNPPDLGPMQVVLNVSNGQADASFFAAQPETRQALEAAMPKLREMMSDAGISLGQATVSTGMPEQQQQHGEPGGRRVARGQEASDGDAGPLQSTGSIPVRQGNGLVDTFA